MSETEIIKVTDNPVVKSQDVINNDGLSPMIRAVMAGQLTTDDLEKMLGIQKDHEAHEAKKAYHFAMAAFKSEAPVVKKDKKNSQYSSMYASKEALVNTVNPYLSKNGLSANWRIAQSDGRIHITCVLTHELGHSEEVTMNAEPDKSGSKNPIQQIKSTKTYLEIATYESVTGIASEYGSCNDDGNSTRETLSPEQQAVILALITKTGADKHKFFKWAKITDLSTVPATSYDVLINALNERDKRENNDNA